MQTVHHPLRTDTPADIQVSFFKPTPEELESLIMGAGVEVHIQASVHQHPVVAVATRPAINTEIGGDPFMRSTGFRCYACCAKEGQPHARHCVEVASAINFAQSRLAHQGSDSCKPFEGPSTPATATEVTESALSFMDFRTGPMATIYRAAGYNIPRHCWAEDAFILERMMRAVLTHGDNWAECFHAQLRVAQDVAIGKHEAATFKKSA